jgi:hypothetical protein
MTMPNTFVVGFERSGTTSLHWTLATHPECLVSQQKEPNFWLFAPDGTPPAGMVDQQVALMEKRSGKTLEAYEALFAGATGRHKAIIDVSPSYLRFAATVAPRLKRALPQAKIIAMIRNPVDHARSLLSVWLGRPATPLELTQALEINIPPPNGGPGLRDHGQQYYQQLWQLYLCFDRDQILPLRFEDLVRGDGLDQIQDFLELSRVALRLRHDNASGQALVPKFGVASARRAVKSILPDGMLRALSPMAHRLRSATIATKAEPLSAALREELTCRYYRLTIHRVAGLTQLNLRPWLLPYRPPAAVAHGATREHAG